MSIVKTSIPQHEALTIPVDAEHGGIRLVVLFAFIAAWLIGFSAVNILIISEGLNIMALTAGFIAGAVVAIPLERYLKGRWKSGRVAIIDEQGIRFEKRGTVQSHIHAEDSASVVFWRFEVQRRTRIPKGWSMIACALESEGRFLAVYTFVSPSTLETLPGSDRYKKLISRKESAKAGDMRGEMRLAGEQRRLLEAETHRWMEGAEMTLEHFQTYLTTVETRFPEWMLAE